MGPDDQETDQGPKLERPATADGKSRHGQEEPPEKRLRRTLRHGAEREREPMSPILRLMLFLVAGYLGITLALAAAS